MSTAFSARVNIGPTQLPQRRGRLPYYARDNMDVLQQKIYDLDSMAALKRPEDTGIDKTEDIVLSLIF